MSVGFGAWMLITYSIGNSLLIIAVGTGIGAANQLGSSGRFAAAGKWVRLALGAAILILGLYLLYLGF